MAVRGLLAGEHSVMRQGPRLFPGLDAGIEGVGAGSDGAERAGPGLGAR